MRELSDAEGQRALRGAVEEALRLARIFAADQASGNRVAGHGEEPPQADDPAVACG